MNKVVVHLKNGEMLDFCDFLSVEIRFTDKPRTYDAESFSKLLLKDDMFLFIECAHRRISMSAANVLYVEFLG